MCVLADIPAPDYAMLGIQGSGVNALRRHGMNL
jgi:hypothetical protein